jgi:TPR repeat protein
MSPKHLVAAIAAALISAPLSAQSVKAGIEAWQRADYSAAVAIWRPLAERGDADAEFNLGQAYRLGRGVPLNLAMAKNWFTKAAEVGHLDAETTLGLLLFQNGDQSGGLKWLRRAADQNEPRALLVYGTALYNGDGVGQNRLLGYAYISRAASQGLSPAKDTLNQIDALMSEGDRQKALLLAKAPPKSSPARGAKGAAANLQAAPPIKPVRVAEAKPVAPKQPTPKPLAIAPEPAPTPARGNWRIQLGAYAQRSSAEALYQRLAGRAAIAGRKAVFVPAGTVTRLQVGPFESKAAAAAACGALGTACFPVPAK